ncbi:unnamed protein product [Lepidochelys kempii]
MDCRIWSCEWFSTQQSKHSMTHFETPSLLFNIVTWSFPRPKLRTGALHAMFASISYKYRQPALLLVHFQVSILRFCERSVGEIHLRVEDQPQACDTTSVSHKPFRTGARPIQGN